MRSTPAVLTVAVVLATLWSVCPCGTAGAGDPGAKKPESPPVVIDPLGPNAACYVCHTTFVHEELSKVHLVAKVDCIKCHGLSDKHANDENVGATKPDIVFKRGQIDAMCVECHDKHDADAKKVVARFIERKLHGTAVVCTECHGTHKIERAAGEGQVANQNGRQPPALPQ